MSFEDVCISRSVRVGFCTARFLRWWYWILQSMADSEIPTNFSRVFHAFLHLEDASQFVGIVDLLGFWTVQCFLLFVELLLTFLTRSPTTCDEWSLKEYVEYCNEKCTVTATLFWQKTWMPRWTELGGYFLSVSVQFQGPRARWDHGDKYHRKTAWEAPTRRREAYKIYR